MELAWIGINAALNHNDASTARRLFAWVDQRIDPDKSTQVARFHHLSAWHALQERRSQQALEHAELALDYANRSGLLILQALAYVELAYSHLELDQRRQARHYLQDFEVISQTIPSAGLRMAGLLCAAYLAFTEERFKVGRKALRQALTLGRRQGIMSLDIWLPQVMKRLCAEALRAGIEADYTQSLLSCHQLLPAPTQTVETCWNFEIPASVCQ